MQRQAIHYFANSNSSRGYVSFYESNFGALERVVPLHGYPLKPLGNLLEDICDCAAEQKRRVEWIHNCLDNTPEGIILPDLSAGVINIPFYAEHNALNLLEDYNIRQTRKALDEAHALFAAALHIHDEWEKVYIGKMDFRAADELAKETEARLIGDRHTEKRGRAIDRYFGAATVNGSFDYIANITQCLGKRYFIKGRPGTGKSTLLKKLVKKAVDAGFEAEVYHCAFDPQSLDMLVVRELDFCIFDSTSPHEYFPSLPTDEIIDVYEAAVEPGTDEKNAKKLTQFQHDYKEQVGKATEKLRLAKESYDRAQQTHLSRLDKAACKESAEQIKSILFRT